jgi:hypothetical protein
MCRWRSGTAQIRRPCSQFQCRSITGDNTWDGTITPAQLSCIATSLTWLSEHRNNLNTIQIQVDNLAFDSERHEIGHTLADVISDLGRKMPSIDGNQCYFSFIGNALDSTVCFYQPHGSCLRYLQKLELLELLRSDLLSNDNGEEQYKNAL